eukprot:GHVH01012615.1.p1 GENE.GHVH01012615.1~~GHVH01012615.1.p1  ORF type:complete len:103 (+),score=2.58 GHVH01012615.1:620-928(+)
MGRTVFPELFDLSHSSIFKCLPYALQRIRHQRLRQKSHNRGECTAAGERRQTSRDMANHPVFYLRCAALLTFADDDVLNNKLLDCTITHRVSQSLLVGGVSS